MKPITSLGVLIFGMLAVASQAEAYVIHGKYQRSALPLPYNINPADMPFGIAPVRQAAGLWSNKAQFDFAFSYQGSSNGRKINGINNVYMDGGRMGWGTLGLCWRYWSGGSMSGFDIALHGTRRWSRLSFLNTILHEFGHAVGLEHSRDSTSVMNASGGSGDRLSDLARDDIAGAAYLYPPSRNPPRGDVPGGGNSEGDVPDNLDEGDGPEGETLEPPGVPVAISPEGEASSRSPTLRWEESARAEGYEVALDHVSRRGRQTKLVRSETLDINHLVLTQALEPGATYYWWVRARNEAGVSEWSDVSSFRVVIHAPGDLSLLAPQGELLTSRPAFSWTEAEHTTHYELRVDLEEGGKVLHQRRLSGTSFTPTEALSVASYHWWVRPWNDGEAGEWAAGAFRVLSDTLNSPQALAPLGSISEAAPEFSWSPVDGATSYELWVRQVNGPEKLIHVQDLSETRYAPESDLPVGEQFHWWVRALAGERQSDWSANAFSLIEPVPAEPPVVEALAPKGFVFSGQPTSRWSEVPGALRYEVRLRAQRRPGLVFAEPKLTQDSFQSASSLPRGRYRWWVRAITPDGPGPWDSALFYLTPSQEEPEGARAPEGRRFGLSQALSEQSEQSTQSSLGSEGEGE